MTTTTTIALEDVPQHSSAAADKGSTQAAQSTSADARAESLESVQELSAQEVDSLLEASETGRYLLDSRGLLPMPDLRDPRLDVQGVYLPEADDDAPRAARGVLVALACTALLWGLIYMIVRAVT